MSEQNNVFFIYLHGCSCNTALSRAYSFIHLRRVAPLALASICLYLPACMHEAAHSDKALTQPAGLVHVRFDTLTWVSAKCIVRLLELLMQLSFNTLTCFLPNVLGVCWSCLCSLILMHSHTFCQIYCASAGVAYVQLVQKPGLQVSGASGFLEKNIRLLQIGRCIQAV